MDFQAARRIRPLCGSTNQRTSAPSAFTSRIFASTSPIFSRRAGTKQTQMGTSTGRRRRMTLHVVKELSTLREQRILRSHRRPPSNFSKDRIISQLTSNTGVCGLTHHLSFPSHILHRQTLLVQPPADFPETSRPPRPRIRPATLPALPGNRKCCIVRVQPPAGTGGQDNAADPFDRRWLTPIALDLRGGKCGGRQNEFSL